MNERMMKALTIKVSPQKIIELNRDNFLLKASIDGSGPVAIVINHIAGDSIT
jgi:hypothetical protein